MASAPEETTEFAKAGALMKEFAVNLGALEKTMKSLAKVFSDPSFGGGDGKKKRKRKVEDGSPKRALSAYQFFFKEYRLKLMKEFPELPNKEIMVKVGEKWRGMDDEQKASYEKQASAGKATYAAELKARFIHRVVCKYHHQIVYMDAHIIYII